MRKLKLEELNRKTQEEFKLAPKSNIVVVLDNIRSAMNVGSFFRTADAFALNKILLCGITARPPHKEIQKTAIGADRSMDWEYFEHVEDALSSLKKEKYTLIGLEQTDQSLFLQDYNAVKNEKYALVFGNEVMGLSDSILPLLDHCIEIPQFGTKHSFNVAVSGGIALWHFMKDRL